ncbi:MAG: cob(I)yrinic acid a,c-diamide adenosyltransferase [Planctomycetota bacterium]
MVKLTKIYTRTGDEGQTGLGDSTRVPKTDPRVEAYGTVDEANASLGLAAVHAAESDELLSTVRTIQNDLFDVGADLCTPRPDDEEPGTALRVTQEQVDRLEKWIDELNADLPTLNSFILPGGTPLAAALHHARTVVRRAERCTVLWGQSQPHGPEGPASMLPIRYLNRLSDLLFVLARHANAAAGVGDVLWKPGG